MRKFMVMTGILLFCFPVIVCAQETGFIEKNDMGFSFFAGAPVGIDGDVYRNLGVNFIYHPLTFISIEPGIFYHSEDEEDTNNITGETGSIDRDQLGFGLGIFYYHNLSTNLYIYAGPRFQFVSYKRSTNYTSGNRSESKTDSRYIVLTVGLKYMFNDHFGVFGDFGYGFGTEETEYKSWDSTGILTTSTTEEVDVNSIISGVVGVSFYF